MSLLRFCLVVSLGALMEMLSVVSLGDAATITVNTTTDGLNADADCSLREAVRAANTDAAVSGCPAGNGADEILVPADTYILAIGPQGDADANRGDLDLRGPQAVTIQGAGAATTILDGNQLDRIFEIRPNGMAIVANVTMRNGNSTLDIGGGIVNYGVLTVLRSTVSGNFAEELTIITTQP